MAVGAKTIKSASHSHIECIWQFFKGVAVAAKVAEVRHLACVKTIRELRKRIATVAELEHICDTIGIINNGKLIEYKTMQDISKMVESNQRVQLMCDYPNYASLVLKKKYGLQCQVVGTSVILPLKESNIAVVISYLVHKKIKVYSIKKIQKSLEELYFEILNSDRPSSSII